MKDYYKTLQIHPEASLEVMNNAYRTLVRQYHPDLFHTSRKAQMNTKMREINEAYQVLSNPVSRAEFDRRYRATNGKPVSTDRSSCSPAFLRLEHLKRLLLWAVGTYVVLRLLLKPFIISPPLKLFLLFLSLYFMMRQFRKQKKQPPQS